MKRRLLVLVAAATLTGCVTASERQAAVLAHDDAKCLSLGVPKGSKPYTDCRMQLESQRATAELAEQQYIWGTKTVTVLNPSR